MSKAVLLLEAFGKAPDPRGAQGRRHPLAAILTLASVAMLSGTRSLYAIAQFGRDRGQAFACALGFTKRTTIKIALFSGLCRAGFTRRAH